MTEPITIPMPQLTEQMEEATIAKWLVAAGEPVAIGDELVEIESDKATMAYASEAAGHLETLADEGDSVAVGQPIARLHEAPVAAGAGVVPGPAEPGPPAPSPAVKDAAEALDESAVRTDGDSRLATPLARRVASDLGVALASVTGTGPRGRVLQEDVLRAAGREVPPPIVRQAAPARTTPQIEPPAPMRDTRRRELTAIQRTIARRMAEAKATVPHFQVSCEVTLDAAIQTRQALLAKTREGERGPSLNDFIVRACAISLREHELVNASFAGDHFELHDGVHVGIAVATDAGLLVATVRDADQRSIMRTAAETHRLASSVRAGTATPSELTGATFTISNLGMFGMSSIVPVINPPHAAILGVGAARETVVLRGGEPSVAQLATFTLSGDHRILNGADAARFLNDVKALIEEPLRLLAS